VNPTRSQKTTVTTLRSSRATASGTSDAPHIPHRRKPSGLSWPQLGQGITRGDYGVGASFNIRGDIRWMRQRSPMTPEQDAVERR
jgi:hypothetical protein